MNRRPEMASFRRRGQEIIAVPYVFRETHVRTPRQLREIGCCDHGDHGLAVLRGLEALVPAMVEAETDPKPGRWIHADKHPDDDPSRAIQRAFRPDLGPLDVLGAGGADLRVPIDERGDRDRRSHA